MIYRFEDEKNRPIRVRIKPNYDAVTVRLMESGAEFEADEKDGWLKLDDGYVAAGLCSPMESDEASEDDEEPLEADTAEGTALESMKVEELKALAEQSGIELRAGMKKAEIIDAILNA